MGGRERREGAGRRSPVNPALSPLGGTSSSLSRGQARFIGTWACRLPHRMRRCSYTPLGIRKGPSSGRQPPGPLFTPASRNAFTLLAPSFSPPLYSNAVSPPPLLPKSPPSRQSSGASSAAATSRRRLPARAWACSRGSTFGPFRGGRADGGCQMPAPFRRQCRQGQ